MCCVGQVDDKIFDALKDAVRTKYAGPAATDLESLFLNIVMIQVCSRARVPYATHSNTTIAQMRSTLH